MATTQQIKYLFLTTHYTLHTTHYTLHTLHYTTLHYTTLHYTTLHYTTLHTTLHYTTLHYTTLHYTTPSQLLTLSRSHSDLTKEFTWSVIDRWATHPRFIELVAKKIKEGLNLFPSDEARKDAIILFSAHSLPHKVISLLLTTSLKQNTLIYVGYR